MKNYDGFILIGLLFVACLFWGFTKIETFNYTITDNNNGYYGTDSENEGGIYFTKDYTFNDLHVGDRVKAYFVKDNEEGLLLVIKR